MKYLPNNIILSEDNVIETTFYCRIIQLTAILNNPDKPDIGEETAALVQELDHLLETMSDSSFKTFYSERYATIKVAKGLYG